MICEDDEDLPISAAVTASREASIARFRDLSMDNSGNRCEARGGGGGSIGVVVSALGNIAAAKEGGQTLTLTCGRGEPSSGEAGEDLVAVERGVRVVATAAFAAWGVSSGTAKDAAATTGGHGRREHRGRAGGDDDSRCRISCCSRCRR